MSPEGADVQRLTRPGADIFDEEPAWGPGGDIAFTRTYLDGHRGRDLMLVPEGGGSVSPLITKGANFSATWSPDGGSIAFIRGLGKQLEAPPGGFQLWTMSVDRSGLHKLTTDWASRPDWAPDGGTIVFDQGSALWVIPALGGSPVRLEPATNGDHPDVGAFPSWSPDGNRIVYMCEARGFGHNDLCVTDADGTGRTVILDSPANESSPAWQPLT